MRAIRIGSRPDNDIVFNEPMVSGRHAEITLEGDRFVLTDLGSTNGTFLEGLPVERVEVEPGQEVGLGSFRFILNHAHLRKLYEQRAEASALESAVEARPPEPLRAAASRSGDEPRPPEPLRASSLPRTLFEDDAPGESLAALLAQHRPRLFDEAASPGGLREPLAAHEAPAASAPSKGPRAQHTLFEAPAVSAPPSKARELRAVFEGPALVTPSRGPRDAPATNRKGPRDAHTLFDAPAVDVARGVASEDNSDGAPGDTQPTPRVASWSRREADTQPTPRVTERQAPAPLNRARGAGALRVTAALPSLKLPGQEVGSADLEARVAAELEADAAAERPAPSSPSLVSAIAEVVDDAELDPSQGVLTLGYHANNDLSIPLPQVSGYHARLGRAADGGLLIVDLGSTNGTFVNNARVAGAARLKRGDRVGLGSYQFRLDDEILDRLARAHETEALDVSRVDWTAGVGGVGASGRVTLGRASDNAIVIPAPQVSGHHAELRRDGERWRVVDLGSTNGTHINVRSRPLAVGDPVVVGPHDVLYLGSYRFPMARLFERAAHEGEEQALPLPEDKETLTIGRGEDNDLVLDAAQVSRNHARMLRRADGWLLEDLGSANGTFVNGVRISAPTPVGPDDLIGFGSFMTRLDPTSAVLRKEYQGELMLRAEGISVDVPDPEAPHGKRRILNDISFTAYPTEFIGIMGPSGAGKTTLMMALNGYLVPSAGRSLINDLDLYKHYNSFRGNIGYVPQDDIIHPELTVFESLYFTAKLRLPPDTTDAEISRLIDRILSDLGILETRNVLIGSPLKKGISGGQRKRVNLAQELITQPSLLFLDEPTSGLASSDTRSVMQLLRRLADEGRTILLTIHQPSLEVYREMDNVLYLARGELVYYGPTYPDSILYFHPDLRPGTPEGDRVLSNPDEAMGPLAQDSAQRDGLTRIQARRDAYRKSKYHRDYVSGRREDHGKVQLRSSPKQRGSRRFGLRQWWTLSRRAFTIKHKDRANLAILLLQAPIIGALISLVFNLTATQNADPLTQFVDQRAQQGLDSAALFMLVASAVWFGTSNAAREIVSEQAIYRRERMVNLKIPSYVASKFAVLSLLSAVQCAMLLGISYPALGFHGSFPMMLLTLWLCSTAGIGIGLMLSALVRSTEAAVALVPLLLIPQLVLGGLIVPIDKLDAGYRPAVRYASGAMVSRWAFEGLLHLEEARRPPPPAVTLSPERQTQVDALEVLLGVRLPPDPSPLRALVPIRSRVERYRQRATAWFELHLADALNTTQRERALVSRYFGRYTSPYAHDLLALAGLNLVFLLMVCGLLKWKDVEVA